MLFPLVCLSLLVIVGCHSEAIDKVDSFLHSAQYEVSSSTDVKFCYHGHSGTKQAYLSGMFFSQTHSLRHSLILIPDRSMEEISG